MRRQLFSPLAGRSITCFVIRIDPSTEVRSMKSKMLCGTALAAAALAAAPVAASAHSAANNSMYTYWFRGTVAAAPAAAANAAPGSAEQFQVNVSLADKGAQHFLNKNGTTLTFTTGPKSVFIAINPSPTGRGNVPSNTTAASLMVGDPVAVQITAPAGMTTRNVLALPVAKVWDYAHQAKVTGALYHFVGKIAAIDSVHGKLTLKDATLDRPAAKPYKLGNGSVTLTFDVATTFLNKEAGVQSLIAPTDLRIGQTIDASLRTDARGTALSALVAAPLWRITHEGPLAQSATS
jgi:hypothetical protein